MNDEYSGQGGSYLLDPETGKRTLIKRTLSATSTEENGPTTSKTSPDDRDGIDVRDGSDSDGSGRGFG